MVSGRSRRAVAECQPMLVGLDLPVGVDQATDRAVAAPMPPSGSKRSGSARVSRARALDFGELAGWVERQVGWIAAKTRSDRHSDLFLFTQAAKLVEEVGELHAELLGLGGRQRDKGVVFDESSLAGEIADVLICVAILAQVTGVDAGAAVRTKMQKVDQRVAALRDAAG